MSKPTHYVKKLGDEVTICGFQHVNTGAYVCASIKKVTCNRCLRKYKEESENTQNMKEDKE